MIKIKKNISFLYFFLFAGAFNDILRIGTSKITLFRILLPLAIIKILLCSRNVRKLYVIYIIIAVISLIQSAIFCFTNRVGILFSFNRYCTGLFYYICIITIIGSVMVIYELSYKNFEEEFERYIVFVGVCYLFVFMYIYHGGYDYSCRNFIINNPNDYGAMLAAVLPLFYFKAKKTKKYIYIVFILVTILYLVLNDCKLALLGVVTQIFIIIYLEIRNKSMGYRKLLIIFSIFCVAIILFLLDKKNITFHGYTWRETVINPIKAMINGDMYTQSNTSVSYRVNTFIASIKWMMKTKMLGIGIGNSGVLIRNILGEHTLYESWMEKESISLHNAFLEIFIEFGFIAIIGVFVIVKKIIKILKITKLKSYQICFVTIVISSLLWLQGPSGITTDYQIFAIFAFLLLNTSSKLLEDQDLADKYCIKTVLNEGK